MCDWAQLGFERRGRRKRKTKNQYTWKEFVNKIPYISSFVVLYLLREVALVSEGKALKTLYSNLASRSLRALPYLYSNRWGEF